MTTGAINNDRFVAKVCEMYYLMDMSQKEIASRLKISRPHICRILSRAREAGIVEIHIHNTFESDTRLEHQLMQLYGLKDVFVVNASGTDNEEQFQEFTREAASYLDNFLSNGMRVGVMSGKSVSMITRQMKSQGIRLGYIVPLVGGIGMVSPDLHANSIAMHMSEEYGGTPLVINAPLIASNAEAASFFRREATIAAVLEEGRSSDVAIVGIGNIDENSTTAKAGGISAEDLQSLVNAGAVSSVCNSYFDSEGKEVRVLSERTIGLGLNDLKNSRVIACAVGENKVKAIRSALLSGYIDVLITNSKTAEKLIA